MLTVIRGQGAHRKVREPTRRAVLVALGALALTAAAPARATTGHSARVDFSFGFSTVHPAAASGATLFALYRADGDPHAKPQPLRKLVLETPAGTVFDGGALPACSASDAELMIEGTAACPAASTVGGGTLSVITGVGVPVDPVETDATLFNSGDGVIEVFTQQGGHQVLGTDRGKFSNGNTYTANPPLIPGGPPDGQTAVREVHFTFATPAHRSHRSFITTPPTCPAGGHWTSRLTAVFADGVSSTATSTTPCARSHHPHHGRQKQGRRSRRR